MSHSYGRGIACPACANDRSVVIDAPGAGNRREIIRIRECTTCRYRFDTVEKIKRNRATEQKATP